MLPGGPSKSAARKSGLRTISVSPGFGELRTSRSPPLPFSHPSELLFLFAEDAHGDVEDRRVVERYHTAVGAGFEVHTHALFGFVFASEIIADGLHVDSQFIFNTLRTAAGQLVLYTA